jgi:hypothetical protein
MKLSFITITGLFFIIGCQKEKSTFYQAYIKNATSHQVKIVPFFSGTTNSNKIILLAAGDSVLVGHGVDWGKVDHAGFNSEYFSGSDSIVVSFDNSYSISHYFNTPSLFSTKYYLYSSLRNLGNYLSWLYSFHDESKYSRRAFYLYRFTEQDYLDAR